MKTKICTKCHAESPADLVHFYCHKGTKDGLYPSCKTCCRLKEKAYRANPKNIAGRKQAQRKWSYKKRYGITIGEYSQILLTQKSRCAVCGCIPKNKRLAIDHNHTTGVVRGLLCPTCNLCLGHFEKYTEQFNKYLKETNNGEFKRYED